MEDHVHTHESWWKQKFKELEAFCKGQSTPVAPPEPDIQAIEPEPNGWAPKPET